jgi:hypothetical protein
VKNAGATQEDIQEMFRILRETLGGLRYAQDKLITVREKGELNSYVIGILTTGVAALDQYLTKSVKNRDTKKDAQRVFGFVMDFVGILRMPLSDDISVIKLRVPTENDPETLVLENASKLIRMKWAEIDTPASQPILVPPKD